MRLAARRAFRPMPDRTCRVTAPRRLGAALAALVAGIAVAALPVAARAGETIRIAQQFGIAYLILVRWGMAR